MVEIDHTCKSLKFLKRGWVKKSLYCLDFAWKWSCTLLINQMTKKLNLTTTKLTFVHIYHQTKSLQVVGKAIAGGFCVPPAWNWQPGCRLSTRKQNRTAGKCYPLVLKSLSGIFKSGAFFIEMLVKNCAFTRCWCFISTKRECELKKSSPRRG